MKLMSKKTLCVVVFFVLAYFLYTTYLSRDAFGLPPGMQAMNQTFNRPWGQTGNPGNAFGGPRGQAIYR
jgi:hypothetical protein